MKIEIPCKFKTCATPNVSDLYLNNIEILEKG